jgi:hypothetical protein
MSHENKFSKDIDNFEKYGTYTYEFDEAGNIVANSQSDKFSQVYLAFSLENINYNEGKIKSFYDENFVEFIPLSQEEREQTEEEIREIQENLEAEIVKNEQLTEQLNDLIEKTESNEPMANTMATKQVIIELRRALGEGDVESDFSDEFPYTPIKRETRESE